VSWLPVPNDPTIVPVSLIPDTPEGGGTGILIRWNFPCWYEEERKLPVLCAALTRDLPELLVKSA
jgi:hypothetical protein